LYGRRPDEHIFVVSIEDDGGTKITFGDGKRGSKLPLGIENVYAKYRTGTGKNGMLKQNQLLSLMNKPLGLRTVTNPLPTTSPQDPESMKDAKSNAPLSIATMDRIVSTQDLEIFSTLFAGIGKAKASKIWDGTRFTLHVSLTTPYGDDVDSESISKLEKSINKFKDPSIKFQLDSFIKKTFSIKAGVRVKDSYAKEKVLSEVKNVLYNKYSFDAREFGSIIQK
jgi:predicted phage baseplate assembly protein